MDFVGAMRKMTEGMKSLGFEIVDSSVYRDLQYQDGKIGIIAGYMPGYACVMSATVHQWYFHGVKISVTAEVCGHCKISYPRRKLGLHNDGGLNSPRGEFSANFQLNWKSAKETIDEIVNHFRHTAQSMDLFVPRFTNLPLMGVVPYGSVEYKDLAEIFPSNGEAEDFWIARVLAMMPTCILPRSLMFRL